MPVASDFTFRDCSLMSACPSATFLPLMCSGETRPMSRSLVSPVTMTSSTADAMPSQIVVIGSSSLSTGPTAAATNSGGVLLSSDRYKTEMCRSFVETGGNCRYGDRCQFAHGPNELRLVDRHPRYKTELCRTFHSRGFCAYGARCHFIHNVDETLVPSTPPPPPSPAVVERILLERRMSEAVLGQLAHPSTSSLSSPTKVPHQQQHMMTSPAIDALNRRLSLDNHVRFASAAAAAGRYSSSTSFTQALKNALFVTSSSTSSDATSSWSQRGLRQPSYGANSPEATDLFRVRSLSLGSAASHSLDSCCSDTSSPGPSSPSSSAQVLDTCVAAFHLSTPFLW